jgi:putative ABC transport system ATP-binding protein
LELRVDLKTVIETKNLKKVYMQGNRPLEVLKGVNLKVTEGEILAIMGPSGSGKSTLLNMIGALDRPSSGKVYINDIDVSTLNDNQLADLRNTEMGFIFQFFNLIGRMDALANVELPMAINGESRSKRRKRAAELLNKVGLEGRLDHKPNQLSGGEQQRVAIARALANNPDLLLCDEVTGNLDTKTGMEIMDLLKELNEEQGKTFVLITHDPRVANITHRLLQLMDGIIVGEKRLM